MPIDMTSPKLPEIIQPKRNVSLTIALTKEEKQALRKRAYEEYMGMGSFVRKIIFQSLNGNGSKQ